MTDALTSALLTRDTNPDLALRSIRAPAAIAALTAALLGTTALPAVAAVYVDLGAIPAAANGHDQMHYPTPAPAIGLPVSAQLAATTRVLPHAYFRLTQTAPVPLQDWTYMTPGISATSMLLANNASGSSSGAPTGAPTGNYGYGPAFNGPIPRMGYPAGVPNALYAPPQVPLGPIVPSYFGPSAALYGVRGSVAPVRQVSMAPAPIMGAPYGYGSTLPGLYRATAQSRLVGGAPLYFTGMPTPGMASAIAAGGLQTPPRTTPRSRMLTGGGGFEFSPLYPTAGAPMKGLGKAPLMQTSMVAQRQGRSRMLVGGAPLIETSGGASPFGTNRAFGYGTPVVISSETIGVRNVPALQGTPMVRPTNGAQVRRPVVGAPYYARQAAGPVPQQLGAGGPVIISSQSGSGARLAYQPALATPAAPRSTLAPVAAAPAAQPAPAPAAALPPIEPTPAPVAAKPKPAPAPKAVAAPKPAPEPKPTSAPKPIAEAKPAPAPKAPASPKAAPAQLAASTPAVEPAETPVARAPEPPTGTPVVTPPAPVAEVPAASPTPPPATPQFTQVQPKQTAALPPAAPAADGRLARVVFAGDSADLDDASRASLGAIAERMKSDEALNLQLNAFARPDDDLSKVRRLSLSRALAVRSYLIEQGVKPARMDVRALGARDDGGPTDRVDLVAVNR